MAMIECRECKNSVSDKAPTCPNCGVVSPGGQAQLEILRASGLTGVMVPLGVWVDSNHVGNIGAGKSVTLSVSPGIHRVECGLQKSGPGYKMGATEVDVPAGRQLRLTVGISKWNGAPKFSPEVI